VLSTLDILKLPSDKLYEPFLLTAGLLFLDNNTSVTFNDLKEVFQTQRQAQYINYLSSITKPDDH
jgi:hypothetical protein